MNCDRDASLCVLDQGISFISIVTANHVWNWQRVRARYESLFSAIHHHGIASKCEVLCIDNSEHPLHEVEAYLADQAAAVRVSYEWCQGFNLLYGLAVNRMVERARYPTIVYFCTNHGRFFDDTWLSDLVAPLADKYCAMAGSLAHVRMDALPENTCGFPDVHIQGGIYAAKTAVLRLNPYSYKLPHVFSDLWITWKLLSAGFEVADVPSIKGTSGIAVNNPERFKYVHDHHV